MNHHLFLVTHGLNNWKSDPQTRSCFAPNGTRDSQQTPASQFRAMNRLSKRVENYRIFSFPIWNFHKHRICFLLIILVSSQTSYYWPPTSTPVCIVHFSSPTSRRIKCLCITFSLHHSMFGARFICVHSFPFHGVAGSFVVVSVCGGGGRPFLSWLLLLSLLFSLGSNRKLNWWQRMNWLHSHFVSLIALNLFGKRTDWAQWERRDWGKKVPIARCMKNMNKVKNQQFIFTFK